MVGSEKNVAYHWQLEDVGFYFELTCDLGQVAALSGPPVFLCWRIGWVSRPSCTRRCPREPPAIHTETKDKEVPTP